MNTTLLEYKLNGDAAFKKENNGYGICKSLVIGNVFEIVRSIWLGTEVKFESFNANKKLWTAFLFNGNEYNMSFLINVFSNKLLTIDITSTAEVISEEQVLELEEKIKQQSFLMKQSTSGYVRIPTIKRGREFSCYDNVSGRLVEYDFDKVVFDKMSEYQHVRIMHSKQYGNCLFLDNDMNMSESDLPYTVAITGSHNFSYDNATILILGGGDGGILHYLRANYNAKHIVMIDIDQVVIEVARKYLRGIAHDSLDKLKGSNYEVIVDDCVKYLKLYKENSTRFDFVINDLTAIPVSTTDTGEQWDFLRLILQLSMDVLTEDGIFLTQVAAFTETRSLEMYNKQLYSLKYNIEYKSEVVCVPSYLEQWVFYTVWKQGLKDNESK